jgi:drug/metabolite transporter (DMT)-like permease
VATYAYVNPVIAVLLGTLILNERLTPARFAGGAFIVGAWCWSCGAVRPRIEL